MINKKIENETTATATNSKYAVKVTSARYLKNEENEQAISFNMVVNHINIFGAIYRAGTSNKGKEYEFISFPAREGTGAYKGKYFNHVSFVVDNDTLTSIKEQIGKVVK